MQCTATAKGNVSARPGRNEPCPCGSGKKYKHCHGHQPFAEPPPVALSSVNPSEIRVLVDLVSDGRLPEAEKRSRVLLDRHPDEGMLWKILSVTLARQGKDALQAMRRTASLMPDDVEAQCNLGAAMHDQGQWAEALQALQQVLRLEPGNLEALVDAADALRALGRTAEAIPMYQRALLLNPQQAEVRNNLGNAYVEIDQHEDAVECYRRALESRSNDARILCNLGTSLVVLGRHEDAVVHLRRAMDADPGLVDALDGLGHALRDLGERREAAVIYGRAVTLAPGRAVSHYNLGNALYELRQVDEAAASYRRALALQPDYAAGHLSLAIALRQLRRPEDAAISCRDALAIDPRYVEGLSLLGELQADRGRFEEAETLFQQAIELRPTFCSAYASIAAHRKMTSDDTAWLRRVETLLAKRLPVADEISLRYALGKYFDDVTQYDSAFSQYQQANNLAIRRGAHYDGPKFSQLVGRIIRDFNAAAIRRWQADAPSSELPVFIIGMPRSGTSLVEQILASHPDVFGVGELPYWQAVHRSFEAAQETSGDIPELMTNVAHDYLNRLATQAVGARRVVDKMPANFLYAGLIHAALPHARIIHMQRHPLDNCLSIYFQNFFNIGPYANELGHLAHYYEQYRHITAHWRALLPATTLLEVPYESLVEDLEHWSRRMVDFIGLPWDPRCLDFHQTDRVVVTASKWQVRQKISKASSGRWRHYESHIGPLRRLLG